MHWIVLGLALCVQIAYAVEQVRIALTGVAGEMVMNCGFCFVENCVLDDFLDFG